MRVVRPVRIQIGAYVRAGNLACGLCQPPVLPESGLVSPCHQGLTSRLPHMLGLTDSALLFNGWGGQRAGRLWPRFRHSLLDALKNGSNRPTLSPFHLGLPDLLCSRNLVSTLSWNIIRLKVSVAEDTAHENPCLTNLSRPLKLPTTTTFVVAAISRKKRISANILAP